MRKDMITSKEIIKDIRTYVSLMFYLLASHINKDFFFFNIFL